MSLDNVRNIILVLSGKGGVGKSSISTQLALSLSLAGKSVGILDIDLTGPSIPRFLGIEDEKVRQAPGGWLPVEVHKASKLPGTSETPTRIDEIGSLHAMSLAFLLASRDTAVVWRGPKKTAMCKQFLSDVLWSETDYLLIDTPPGTSDEHISVVETLLKKVSISNESSIQTGPRLAGAVLVTTPQAISTADVRKEINFCAKTGVPIIGVIENMSGYVCPCCGVSTNLFSKGGGEIMATEFGIKFLGGVPVDQHWGILVEEGTRPVYKEVNEPDGDSVENGTGEGDEEETDDTARRTASGIKKHDDALLVDKYRDCSLHPIFREITKQVIQTVENGTAVMVDPNASRNNSS